MILLVQKCGYIRRVERSLGSVTNLFDKAESVSQVALKALWRTDYGE